MAPVGTRSYPILLAFSFVVVIAVAAGLVYGQFGSLQAARAHFEGRDLVAADAIEVGSLAVLESKPFQITLTNLTDRPYSVVGTNWLCRCRVDTPLPVSVPPGGQVVLDMAIRVPSGVEPGPGECTVEFVTDAPHALLLRQPVRYTVR